MNPLLHKTLALLLLSRYKIARPPYWERVQ
jgi:hypothetical protein